MAEEKAEQPVAIVRKMGELVFDAVFDEQHESQLEVTDNPVETGVVVSDHAFMKPLRLTITAGVTNTLLREVAGDDKFAGAVSRAQTAFELLGELQRKAEPFDVQTGLKLYKSMLCTSVRVAQDVNTANALVFSAEIREVIIVSTEVIKYPPRAKGATQKQASKKVEKGEQQGKETPTKNKSIAKSLSSAGSSFFGKPATPPPSGS
jgi:hypothetical protein